MDSAAIIAECQRRGYTKIETLAILTLALDQAWTVIDPLALNRYEVARDGHHSTPDAWYSIAVSRGVPATLWQAFKDTLYTHMHEAQDLYDGKGASVTATKNQVAQLIVHEAQTRGHIRNDCLAEMSALYQESEWNETIWDSTHVTYGVAQQDGSYAHRFEGAAAQIKAFFDKLDTWQAKPGASSDIWLNICWLQQAPNWDSAQYWFDHGRKEYLTEIKSRIATVTPYLDKYWPINGGIVVPDNRPNFNEINKIGIENGSHSSIRSQLPKNWFLHTQQGNGNAEDLFNFLMSTSGSGAVSYHYAIAEDRNDHGVTVVDVCDTNRYSWSVLNANVFSINACFAGSFAEQTRDQWLANYRNAIRVAAYLAVQDCKKYPTIAAVVIPPPYANHGSGISDHRFVTQALGIGSHTDVGGPMTPPWNGFPWDVFAEDVKTFLLPVTTGPNTPPPTVDTTPVFTHPTQDVMIRELWDQFRGPAGKGWPQDDNRTPVETIWALGKKAGI